MNEAIPSAGPAASIDGLAELQSIIGQWAGLTI
jgi:hypothetical protein